MCNKFQKDANHPPPMGVNSPHHWHEFPLQKNVKTSLESHDAFAYLCHVIAPPQKIPIIASHFFSLGFQLQFSTFHVALVQAIPLLSDIDQPPFDFCIIVQAAARGWCGMDAGKRRAITRLHKSKSGMLSSLNVIWQLPFLNNFAEK